MVDDDENILTPRHGKLRSMQSLICNPNSFTHIYEGDGDDD